MNETLSPHSLSTSASAPTVPIDAGVMFADLKGVHNARIEKRQRRLLKLLPFLNEFLEDGEQLKFVTKAVSPTSILDQLTTGMNYVYLKRCLLVITDRRIFHIPTNAAYRYRNSIAEIRYGDAESIVQKGSRLIVRYRSGRTGKFLYIQGSERKRIRRFFEAPLPQGATTRAGGRIHLCPRCHAGQQADVYTCPKCGLEFKTRSKAMWLSILLPGGGYFYCRHPLLGIGDAIAETALLALVLFSASLAPEIANQGDSGVVLFLVLLIIEKLITIYHAWHFVGEYLPQERKILPVGAYA